MAYHGTTNMRCLRSYIHALSHYESIKPFRGSDVRPLESRRKKHVTIRLGAYKDVIIRQHNTDVLTYKADDTVIINNGGWASMTTHELLQTVSPFNCTGHQNQTWITSFFDTPTGERKHGSLPLRNNAQEEFRYDAEKNNWLRVNPLFPTVGAIDREAAKRVRAQYAKFKTYALGCLKLLGEGNRFTPEVFKEVLGADQYRFFGGQDAFEKMRALMLSESTEDNFKALLHLVNPYSDPHETFTRAFDDTILHLHANEMVTTREVYTGEWVTNKYKRYTG